MSDAGLFLPGPRIGALHEPLTGRVWQSDRVVRRWQARLRFFQDEGVGRADSVVILRANDLEFFIDLLAIWSSGACAIPIDPRLTPFEISRVLATARPSFASVPPSLDQAIAGELEKQDVRLLGFEPQGKTDGPDLRRANAYLDDPALILFTSGTTGDPKGVVHSHRTLRARWSALAGTLGLAPYRKSLCLLPTHFGHGLICNSLFPWLHGADLAVLPSFNAEVASSLGRIIDEQGITFLSSVPALWRLVLRVSRAPQGESLKRVHCGSAPLSKSLWEDIRAWTGIKDVFNTYGITETGSWTAGTTLGGFEPEDGLIGLPWGAEVKILPTAETEACGSVEPVASAGTEGYIWLNTPALMQGYLDREDLTRNVVWNGWFSTGDAGFLDERGCLYLKGRLREEINKGGMKVYPADVDAAAEGVAGVMDVCTFPCEDPLYDQNVGIALVVDGDPDKIMPQLRTRMAEKLGRHQMPVRWHLVAAIPRTSRGKINRNSVAESCSASPRYAFPPAKG